MSRLWKKRMAISSGHGNAKCQDSRDAGGGRSWWRSTSPTTGAPTTRSPRRRRCLSLEEYLQMPDGLVTLKYQGPSK